MRPRALMTAYIEGSIVTRELREMLNDELDSARFERELLALDTRTSSVDMSGDELRRLAYIELHGGS